MKEMFGSCEMGFLGSTSKMVEESYDIGDVRFGPVAEFNLPINH